MCKKEIDINAELQKEVKKFGSVPESSNLTKKAIGDVSGYKMAIRRAARDLTARTLTRKEDAQGDLVAALLDEKNGLLKAIIDFFNLEEPMEEEKFDEWHNTVCNDIILPEIRKIYTQKNGKEVYYGKAQKILNMTLKGCYCLSGADKKQAYFKHCHITLDSFTLAWYKANGGKEAKNEWSNIEENEYKAIQRDIRDNISPKFTMFGKITPFQKEFFIWPMEIMISTVKELNKTLGGIRADCYVEQYFENRNLSNELKMSKALLGMYVPETTDLNFIDWLNRKAESKQKIKNSAEYILTHYALFPEEP